MCFLMIIRKFEPLDFEGIVAIEYEAFTEHNPYLYMNFYEMNRDTFLVAQEDKMIVGFVVGYRSGPDEGRVFTLAVGENFRKRGIG